MPQPRSSTMDFRTTVCDVVARAASKLQASTVPITEAVLKREIRLELEQALDASASAPHGVERSARRGGRAWAASTLRLTFRTKRRS